MTHSIKPKKVFMKFYFKRNEVWPDKWEFFYIHLFLSIIKKAPQTLRHQLTTPSIIANKRNVKKIQQKLLISCLSVFFKVKSCKFFQHTKNISVKKETLGERWRTRMTKTRWKKSGLINNGIPKTKLSQFNAKYFYR
jgi:hypothetical protein